MPSGICCFFVFPISANSHIRRFLGFPKEGPIKNVHRASVSSVINGNQPQATKNGLRLLVARKIACNTMFGTCAWRGTFRTVPPSISVRQTQRQTAGISRRRTDVHCPPKELTADACCVFSAAEHGRWFHGAWDDRTSTPWPQAPFKNRKIPCDVLPPGQTDARHEKIAGKEPRRSQEIASSGKTPRPFIYRYQRTECPPVRLEPGPPLHLRTAARMKPIPAPKPSRPLGAVPPVSQPRRSLPKLSSMGRHERREAHLQTENSSVG